MSDIKHEHVLPDPSCPESRLSQGDVQDLANANLSVDLSKIFSNMLVLIFFCLNEIFFI